MPDRLGAGAVSEEPSAHEQARRESDEAAEQAFRRYELRRNLYQLIRAAKAGEPMGDRADELAEPLWDAVEEVAA